MATEKVTGYDPENDRVVNAIINAIVDAERAKNVKRLFYGVLIIKDCTNII